MDKQNHFQFTGNEQTERVGLLSATMSDFSYSKHAHEEYSIGLTLKGRQDFFCKNAFYKSPPGGVMLFNPEDIHDGHSGGEQNLEYVMLYVHPDEFSPLFRSLGYAGKSELRLKDTLFDDPMLRQQVWSMSGLLQSSSISQIDYESNLYSLAQTLVKNHGSLDLGVRYSRTDTLLLRAKDFILANFGEEISIDAIAASANMSKYHFIRMFRAQFGITPHQYVLNCRINHARKRLLSGLSATQAAVASGFADVSHLNRNFKQVFGMTPKQFQLQWSR
nr:AraC family transcriptional regulator [uncultured Vibrio sp.]